MHINLREMDYGFMHRINIYAIAMAMETAHK